MFQGAHVRLFQRQTRPLNCFFSSSYGASGRIEKEEKKKNDDWPIVGFQVDFIIQIDKRKKKEEGISINEGSVMYY